MKGYLHDCNRWAMHFTARLEARGERWRRYPPQWLPVLLLTAAPSPPPPSSMPPPPSSPPGFVLKSSYWLKRAAKEFDIDPAAAIARYGPIADWDVSAISTMRGLFYNLPNFNADISSWDTSSVTDMGGLFYNSPNFNADISSWDTSRVTDMRFMFFAARAFDQPLSFDTSSVTAMTGMFQVSSSLPPIHMLLPTAPFAT